MSLIVDLTSSDALARLQRALVFVDAACKEASGNAINNPYWLPLNAVREAMKKQLGMSRE